MLALEILQPVYIDNQVVVTVSKFTYLGSDIDSEGYSYPEIHKLLGMASFIMSHLDNGVNKGLAYPLSSGFTAHLCSRL